MAVYSEDRVRRLRMVLWIVVAVGALIALAALITLAGGSHRGAGLIAAVVAATLLGSSGMALRLVGRSHPKARLAVVATAIICVLSGVISGSWVAFLLLLVGLGLMFLGLLPDEVEGAGSRS